MTFLEKRMKKKPNSVENELIANQCPHSVKLETYNDRPCKEESFNCVDCWNRPIPEETYSMEEVKEMLDITDEDLAKVQDEIEELSYAEAWESFQDAKKEFNLAEHMDKLGNYIVQGFCDSIESTVEKQKVILDSGERRQFETGAVRDIQEGKGRCDLMPLDIVAAILDDVVLFNISEFTVSDDVMYLKDAIGYFNNAEYGCPYTMLLEVAKHFEEGAKKYGENNWQKGIPTKHYIDSAVRHYLKHLRGDQDEPHDRAFVWNLMCCMWTVINKPELDDYFRFSKEEEPCSTSN